MDSAGPARMQLVEVLIEVHDALPVWASRSRREIALRNSGRVPESDELTEILLERLREILTAMTHTDDDHLTAVGLFGPELDIKVECFRTALVTGRRDDAMRVAAVLVGAIARLPGLADIAFPVADYLSILTSAPDGS